MAEHKTRPRPNGSPPKTTKNKPIGNPIENTQEPGSKQAKARFHDNKGALGAINF